MGMVLPFECDHEDACARLGADLGCANRRGCGLYVEDEEVEAAVRAASVFLEKKGMEVKERRGASGDGLGAVAALDGDALVFADVYAAQGRDMSLPDPCAVDRMPRTSAFLDEHPEWAGRPVRLETDVVLSLGDDGALLRHYKDVGRRMCA